MKLGQGMHEIYLIKGRSENGLELMKDCRKNYDPWPAVSRRKA